MALLGLFVLVGIDTLEADGGILNPSTFITNSNASISITHLLDRILDPACAVGATATIVGKNWIPVFNGNMYSLFLLLLNFYLNMQGNPWIASKGAMSTGDKGMNSVWYVRGMRIHRHQTSRL